MNLPSSTLSAAILGDDLHLARVECSLFRAKARAGGVLRGFLAMPDDEARAAIAALADPPPARVILTLPSDWCGVRPIGVARAHWPRARAGILGAIDSFLPVAPDDAEAGYLRRDPAGDRAAGRDVATSGSPSGAEAESPGGWLIGARRSLAQPWIDALRRATGASTIDLLSPHMAMLGLGLQHAPAAAVLERTPSGSLAAHRLRFGRAIELGAPWEGELLPGEGSAVMLTGVSSEPPPPGVRAVTPEELAIAAALAPIVARDEFAPLAGRTPRAAARWLAPAGLAAGAIALLLAAGWVREARYERAIARLTAEQERLAPAAREAERHRDRARRLAALVESGVRTMQRDWTRVAPLLAEAQNAVPPEGFLYRVRLDDKGVTIDGESPRYLDALGRLEDAPSFAAARQVNPSVSVSDRKMDMFSLRAEREKPAPASSPAPPSSAPDAPASPPAAGGAS